MFIPYSRNFLCLCTSMYLWNISVSSLGGTRWQIHYLRGSCILTAFNSSWAWNFNLGISYMWDGSIFWVLSTLLILVMYYQYLYSRHYFLILYSWQHILGLTPFNIPFSFWSMYDQYLFHDMLSLVCCLFFLLSFYFSFFIVSLLMNMIIY